MCHVARVCICMRVHRRAVICLSLIRRVFVCLFVCLFGVFSSVSFFFFRFSRTAITAACAVATLFSRATPEQYSSAAAHQHPCRRRAARARHPRPAEPAAAAASAHRAACRSLRMQSACRCRRLSSCSDCYRCHLTLRAWSRSSRCGRARCRRRWTRSCATAPAR